MCGVNGRRQLSCYLNSIRSVGLWKCLYDHCLANRAYFSAITVKNVREFLYNGRCADVFWRGVREFGLHDVDQPRRARRRLRHTSHDERRPAVLDHQEQVAVKGVREQIFRTNSLPFQRLHSHSHSYLKLKSHSHILPSSNSRIPLVPTRQLKRDIMLCAKSRL